jgi:parallel beta-helix repeat protein
MKKTLLFIKMLVAVLFASAQGNIAPNATVTADGAGGGGCRTGACSTLNDLNFGTCGTQQMWISTTPPNAVGVDYIRFDFPIPETFDTIIIHHGQSTGRFLSGGTIQYFDGANWITHASFSNLPMQCVSRIPIPKLTTDVMRITSFLMQGTGQLSNPNFREIEIISAPNGFNDAAVLSVDSPSVFCAGMQDVYATIGNLGLNQIDSVTVNWEVNGVTQTPVLYNQQLDTIGGLNNFNAQILLGSAMFNAGINTLAVYTTNPNGVADTVTANDTMTVFPTTATPPQSVIAVNQRLTSVDIQVNGYLGTLAYEYDLQGFTLGSGLSGTSSTSLIPITGLAQGSTYDVYVRSICGAGDSSAWVGPITFNTSYGVPYFEDFTSFTAGTTSNPWPNAWSSTNSTSNPRWESEDASGSNENSSNTGPFYDNTTPSTVGGMYMYLETSGGAGDSAEFVSPPIYIDTNMTNVLLEFYYHMYGATMGDLKVFVDTNGVSNLLTTISGQQQTAGSDPFNLFAANLVGYQGTSVILRFRGISGSSFNSDMSIDDIRISPVSNLNAGVIELQSPTGALCPGSLTPVLGVKNFGSDTLSSVKVMWDINGVLDSLTYTAGINPGDTASVTLPTFTVNSTTIYDIRFYTKDPNMMPDPIPADDSLSFLGLRTGLSGTYTVDANIAPSTTNFTSFTDLTTQLSSYGVCGAVTVNVANGTYLEPLEISGVVGGDMNNTLTIDGGDSSLTIISEDGTNSFAALTVANADYVTIKNISFIYTGLTGSGAILANANNIEISNCQIIADTNSTNFNHYGVSLSGAANSHSTAARTDNVTLKDNVIKGGYYGIRAYGSTTDAVNNLVIDNNVVDQAYYYGVYVYYGDTLTLTNNVIDAETRNNAFADAAYVWYTPNFDISGNIMRGLDYGMYVYDFSRPFAQTRKNRIANNMIFSDSDYGLYMYYVDSTEIFHNTIVTNSTSIPAVQIYSTTSTPIGNYDVRNNIFYANGSFALRTNIPDTIFQMMDYNNYYTSGLDLFSINSVTYSNIASYTTANANFNANSVEGDPTFINYPLDLHVLGALANDAGDNSVGITVDIDGDTRPMPGSTTVDMGADEFDPPSCVPPTATAFTNVTINSADVNFTSASTGTSFRYEFGTFGFTPGTGTSVLSTTATSTISGLASGTTYELYVREICSPTDSSPVVGPYQFATAYSVPLNEDFETFTVGNSGTSFTNGWTNSGTSRPNWESEASTGANLNSLNTGPWFDATTPTAPGGKYMYLETSGGSLGNTNDLSSPSIFVPASAGGVILEFAYHMYGATMGDLHVLVDTNNVLDTVISIIGQQQTAGSDAWRDTSALLVGYQGKSMKLVFRGVRGSSFTSDMSIDNVRLFDTVAVDVALDTIVSPMSDCGLSNQADVTIAIENRGLSPASGISATYIFDGGAPVTETVPVTINPGTTYNFTFAAKVNASAIKSYTLDASISLAADGDTTNNVSTGYTFVGSFSDSINTNSPTKYYTFESNDGNFVPSGTNSSWEWGTPSSFYINGAIGTKAWVTSAAGNHNANELSYLESSCYDLSTIAPTTPIFLNFQTLFKTEIGSDQVWMEYSIDNGRNWSKVVPSVASVNFYNNTTDNVWEGFSTGGVGTWIPVLNDLQGLGGNSKVKFRFVFVSNGTLENDGFAIDEFQVGTIVGIDEQIQSGAATLGLSPNPAKDVLNMVFGNYAKGDYQVSIINANGQVVQEEVLTVGSSLEVKTVSVSNLDAGVYFVRTMNGEQISTQRLIIK